MTENFTDFTCSIAIVQPSPITADMIADLPSIWNTGQNEPQYAALYGVGLAFEDTKNRIKQLQANNTLYSPLTQKGFIAVQGSGKYIVEFDLPFVQPPLDISISGASITDVYIEFISRFSMIINVTSEINDNLYFYASGFIGAASEEYLGDALQLNFGDLYGFTRTGDAIINDSYVSFYETTNVFMDATSIIPLQNISVNFDNNGNIIGSPTITTNAPPINAFFLKGVIQPTSLITSPHVSHELVDTNGNLIALVDATTLTSTVSSYYPTTGLNAYKTNNAVYVIGSTSTYDFNRWNQPSYQQEVFRADNQYRRILAAINKAIFLGPTIAGLADLLEALLSQPFIPAKMWEESDYRVFSNSPNATNPKYITYTKDVSGNIIAANSSTQMNGYPSIPPIVEVRRINQQWSPDKLTYNNKPTTQSLDVFTSQQITELNTATRFDMTNEVIRQLRLGLDSSTGGVINWNYAGYTGTIPSSGASLYENYNYFFLNNVADEASDIILYWHAQQSNTNGPTSYRTYGPLLYNKDYFVLATSLFKNLNGTYNLPSELLQGYYADSSIPYHDGTADVYGNTRWLGATLVANGTLLSVLPNPPTIIFQMNLQNYSMMNSNIATKFPTNIYDYLLYSYNQVQITSSYVVGNIVNTTTLAGTAMASYYDPTSSSSLQPSDSPFVNYNGRLLPNALAQSPFTKFITSTGYEYILDMRSGNMSFNKTVLTQNIKTQSPINASQEIITPPGILVMQVNRLVNNLSTNNTQIGTNQFVLTGKVSSIIAQSNKRYLPYNYGNYVLLDDNNNPIAILDSTSAVNFSGLVGTTQTIYGYVLYTLWDTRIPVQEYRTDSPIFQVVSNDDTLQFIALTPEIDSNALNQNYMVEIFGLPSGIQQNLTATWTFNIRSTSNASTYVQNAIGFADTVGTNGKAVRGIISLYCGIGMTSNNLDPDGAIYGQGYTSGDFPAYFLNYSDYINDIGSSLTPLGDKYTLNTLTNPIIQKRIPGQSVTGTILNYFIPNYGFISTSILPNQIFYENGSGIAVNVIRPNNNGLSLQISGDSYAGLTFYVNPQTKIVDKPTRLIADFIFESSDSQIRKKTIEVGNGGSAGWVNGSQPNTVQNNETFYIAGNMYKYTSIGYDQASNQYADNGIQTVNQSGSYYDRNPETSPNGTTTEPIFEIDKTLNGIISTPGSLGDFGPVMRYRRPPKSDSVGSVYNTPQLNALQQNYYNTTPEKIAYLEFDLSGFPYDTIINSAILEIHFASGFTIEEAIDKNLSLNKNNFWSNSRLSGNGKTFLKTLKNPDNSQYSLYSPMQNTHWRKNFINILIPHAFYSEPNGTDYGIANLFNFGNTNTLPQVTNPTPCLEYLGYVNIDEINVAGLSSSGIENTVGLTNVILSEKAIIYQINGILSFTQDMNSGEYNLLNCMDAIGGFIYSNTDNCSVILNDTNASLNYTVLGKIINQLDILPNMKLLIYPFPDDLTTYFYGYCTTILPSQQINFDANNISVYQEIIQRVMPLYAEWSLELLESDTYNTYMEFNRNTNPNSIRDISY